MTSALECTVDTVDGLFVVRSPAVGRWRARPGQGETLAAGAIIGELEVLGRYHALRMPEQAFGAIVGGRYSEPETSLAVAFGDELLRLDPSASAGHQSTAAAASSSTADLGLVYKAPSSGRFWHRPSPDAEAFVTVGSTLESGDPVGLLEVMKTFTRLAYEGKGLPSPARVVRIHVGDGEDVDQGAPLLEVEAI